MGLISDELYEAAQASCGEDDYATPSTARCANALQDIDLVTADINPVHVLEPSCGFALRDPAAGGDTVFTKTARLLLQVQDDRLGLPVECRDNGYRLSYIWADDAEVRETLGIREGSIGAWSRCITLAHYRRDERSSIPYHANLTRRGYRALVYNGDHDLDFTFVGTQAWIRTLGYPVVAPWRPWYSSGQVAGFTTEYAYNLTYATVKGAGHTAPEYRPKECLDMLRRWTSPAGKL
jgi:serine carboxypeptidase-like clade 1